ncbi:MAG: hypothetical protein ACR2NU_13655 [Aeoliella sp.]
MHGKIFYKDQPVVGVDVTFMGPGASVFSAGKTDGQGNYSLTTYEPDDGAIVGRNLVAVAMPIVSQDQSLPESPLTGEYFDLMKEAERNAAKSPLPARFADPVTSGLVVEVTAGPNRHDLHLRELSE